MAEDYVDWLLSFQQENRLEAAKAAVKDLGRSNQRTRELLEPALARLLLVLRREVVHEIERATPVREVFSGETTLAQRKTRLSESFALPESGRRVRWDEATVEDHEERIAYLRKKVNGIEVTIAEHESAIWLIREHGVSCLADIGEAA